MEVPGKLPPLGMLRVFESAARLGSFAAAALELHVTHSAVSHQMRGLEDQLGFALFHREGRGVRLTLAGLELAERVNAALCDLGQAVAVLHQRSNPNRLTITTMPSFAARWLAPRIGGFLAAAPEVELNVVSTESVLNFARDGIDIAIRFGFGHYPGHDATLLMRDELLTVASPDLLARVLPGYRLPLSPEQLFRLPLLRSDGESWQSWFQAAGHEGSEPQGGLLFNDSALVLQAALDHHGIALTRRSLCQLDIDAGRLLQVSPTTVLSSRAYWFVTPGGVSPSPMAQRFRQWLFAEAERCPPITAAPDSPVAEEKHVLDYFHRNR